MSDRIAVMKAGVFQQIDSLLVSMKAPLTYLPPTLLVKPTSLKLVS